MMFQKILLIVNPNAGKEGYRTSLTEILRVFCEAGCEPTVFFTKYSMHAAEIVVNNCNNYDLIVCLGGDGTLSEVSAGVMMSARKLPIGYIPLGTANDVARTLGLSSKPVEAARNILTGSPFPFDIGKFGQDRFFTYIAAFGAFTEVSYATPSELKHSLGHLAYMLEAAKSITKITATHALIEYDNGVLEDDFIFGAISNSTSVAGLFKLDSRDVNLSDGMFEILLIRKPKSLDDLNQIITEILLMNFTNENVFFLKSSKIRLVFSSPTSFTRDGEDGGSHREVNITNCHPGVEIIV